MPEGEYDGKVQELLAHPKEVRDLAEVYGVAVPFSMVLHEELDQIEATRGHVHRVQRPSHADPAVAAAAGRSGEARRFDARSTWICWASRFRAAAFEARRSISACCRRCRSSVCCGSATTSRRCRAAAISAAGWPPGSAASRTPPATARTRWPTFSAGCRRFAVPNPMDERVRPIRFLREYSNYLTPRTGFFSADTWTMVGIYLRNALLNQVIIVSLFGAALIVPVSCSV